MRTVLVAIVAAVVLAPLGASAQVPVPVAPPPPVMAPVPAPVAGGVIRSFRPPASAYGAGHRGVDLAAGPRQAVRAPAEGTVAFAGQVAGTRWVSIDHGGGVRTTYGALGEIAVRVGQVVRAGQTLARLAASATHLDWGALVDGVYVDPLLLFARGPRLRWSSHLVHPDALGAPRSHVALPVVAPAGDGGGRLRMPVAGRLSSGFGTRVHPVTGRRRLHAGLDIAAPTGTLIAAAGRRDRPRRGPGRGLRPPRRGGPRRRPPDPLRARLPVARPPRPAGRGR